MEIEITEQKRNDLLDREEIVFRVNHEFESTPTRDTIIAKLAAILNAEKDRTVLKEVQGGFGVNYSTGYANLYDTAEIAIKVEPKHVLKRNGLIGDDKK